MIRHACAKCRKIIPHKAYSVRINEAGKLEFTVRCHGETETFVRAIFPDIEGVLFSGMEPAEISERRPEAWVKLANAVLADNLRHGGLLTTETLNLATVVAQKG